MQGKVFREKDLTEALIRVIKNKAGDDLCVENIRHILNQSGITREHNISAYYMLEALAPVLHALGIRRTDNYLKQALIYFIADYPVFRWSELRYRFPSDPEQEIEKVLYQLKYRPRELVIDGEQEVVWCSRWLLTHTIKKRLAARPRVGDPAFFEFLNYKPQR
ncbi:hypothetical protein SG34_032095 [Thalassomonas viridans]|uniref:Uncharacterized protein n=1 Tax=Thalassomonas viridans TaxID=137584 RepID=A0AAF0CD76_9GAMM|nr:hypothetical protein [Thalassomonas viridans]WDE08566.1 hypothetical protein SG34_032095 [Thalassomonas viridans]